MEHFPYEIRQAVPQSLRLRRYMYNEQYRFSRPEIGSPAKMREIKIFAVAQILAGVNARRQLLHENNLARGEIIIVQFAAATTSIACWSTRILEHRQDVVDPLLIRREGDGIGEVND